MLHGAGAEGIKSGVHAEIFPGEIGVMADNVRLAHLREAGEILAKVFLRERVKGKRNSPGRGRDRLQPFSAPFKNHG